MKSLSFAVLGLAVAGFSPLASAVNNAAADVDTVTLRTSCTENAGATEIPNCFNSMAAVDNWLRTVRFTGPSKPTVVNIGPGTFIGWECESSNVTLRGSGRDQTVFVPNTTSAMVIGPGCTNINVQDMTLDSKAARWGVFVANVSAITSWTNVEIISQGYGWDERISGEDGSGTCPNHDGKHMWFSSRIRVIGNTASSRAYTARCAQSWFWGSEITADVTDPTALIAFALKADQAEVHLYGSNARLLLPVGTNAVGYQSPNTGQFLMAAINGGSVHIHGTGLDVVHKGAGTADMLYADAIANSHFHANESGFNIHVTGSGKVRRLAGPGTIEAPYLWGQSTVPPLSLGTSGVQTLISKNGADRYIETDCPLNGNCGSVVADKTYPHEMIYRAECTGTSATTGPWFDLSTKACRQ